MAKTAPKIRSSGRSRSRLSDSDFLEAYRVAKRYFRRPYVRGISIGEKIRSGALQEGNRAICIHVEEKFPPRFLRKEQVFPKEILGVPVDVVERMHRAYDLSDEQITLRQIEKNQPLHPGVAISTEKGQFGTLGIIVYDCLDHGKPCLLTAAHVLGTSNSVVLQPGANMGGVAVASVTRTLFDDDGDAAIALLNGTRSLELEPIELGFVPQKSQLAFVGQRLVKSGARTGRTEGIVTSVGEISVDYKDEGIRKMKGFEIRPVDPNDRTEISEAGDSGALWVDPKTESAVGICVGGDRSGDTSPDEFALACYIDLVCKRLQVVLDPNDWAK